MHVIYEEKSDINPTPLLLKNDTYSYESSQYKLRKSSEVSVDSLGQYILCNIIKWKIHAEQNSVTCKFYFTFSWWHFMIFRWMQNEIFCYASC